jgi:hypothetical protein
MIRAGRQEVNVAEGRLIAAPNWGQGGQSFDGVRWFRPLGGQRLEIILLRTREDSSPTHDSSGDLLAAWYAIPIGGHGEAEFYAVDDRHSGTFGTHQSYLGAVWAAEKGPFSARVQGIRQIGEREGVDVRASLLALRAGLSVLEDRGSVTLWYDRLSGDSDPGDDVQKAFSTLYGARFRYYGRANHFVDIPMRTGGLGLQDAALKLSYSTGRDVQVNLDLHAFRTSESEGISDSRLGEEADFWIRFPFRRHLTAQAGYSVTRAGPAMEELGILRGTGHFAYLMTSLRF